MLNEKVHRKKSNSRRQQYPALYEPAFEAWQGMTWEEAHRKYSFEDYRKALEGAGPKLKELILWTEQHMIPASV